MRCLEFLDLSPSSRKTKNLLAGYTLQISRKMLRTSRLTLSLASPTWQKLCITRYRRCCAHFTSCCFQLHQPANFLYHQITDQPDDTVHISPHTVFSFTNLAKIKYVIQQLIQVSLKMLHTSCLMLSLASPTWQKLNIII